MMSAKRTLLLQVLLIACLAGLVLSSATVSDNRVCGACKVLAARAKVRFPEHVEHYKQMCKKVLLSPQNEANCERVLNNINYAMTNEPVEELCRKVGLCGNKTRDFSDLLQEFAS